jgi:para-nitrobenzyl esterase
MTDTGTVPDQPASVATRAFETPVGQIVGRVDGDVVRVLGVPYAVAKRFERPRPRRPVFGPDGEPMPVLALHRSPTSPQLSSPVVDELIEGANDGLTFLEDCHALSITIPSDQAPEERFPVMIWIHGGGYVSGAGDSKIHDPHALVVEQRVIVVTINYRLGMLGYYGDGKAMPANMGLFDQLAAVRWVHENIEAFGGAADSITLFGQSAGGDAVAHLMISEESAGLFQRAIVQSAPLGISRGRARMVRAMVKAAGAPSPDAPLSEVLALQGVAERAARRFGLRGAMAFGTQYGHAPLPPEKGIDDAWRAVAPDVDVLIGSVVDETRLYIPLLPRVSKLTRLPVLGKMAAWLLVRLTTHAVYTRGVRHFAARHRAAGGRAVIYELKWAPERSPVGAAHLTDVPLLLGSRDAWTRTSLVDWDDWPEIDARGRQMRQIWADFARTGTVTADDDAGLRSLITFDRG